MESAPPPGRIESTRRSLLTLKRGLAIGSVVAFAAAAALARSADLHGSSGTSGSTASVSRSDDGAQSDGSFFGDDGGSIAPSQGVPQGSTSQS
jgi:hypothetical protein